MKKTFILLLTLLLIFLGIVAADEISTERQSYLSPCCPQENLRPLLQELQEGKTPTAADYRELYAQTGLDHSAVQAALRRSPEILLEAQQNYFSQPTIHYHQIVVTTTEERTRKANFHIVDLRDGDILLTKSTHTLGWRHGHAAIVIDAAHGQTLEAASLGQNSCILDVHAWERYPTFIQLRMKDVHRTSGRKESVGELAALLAKKYANEIPYGFFSGAAIFPRPNATASIAKTQCAHLAWYPYHLLGFDLDADGHWPITPKDIAQSDLLEVVQVYGVDPFAPWP